MTYTTSLGLLIEDAVFDELVGFMADADISRRIFAVHERNSGDSVRIVREGKWPAATEVQQTSEVPVVQPDYTEKTEIFKKIGYRVQITHEMIADARWDLVRNATLNAGQQLGLKMSIDVLREAWNTAGIQVHAVSGHWGGAYADEIGDIADSIGLLHTLNYVPDVIVVHPKQYAQLSAMDEFIHKEKGGDIRRFDVGSIMGLDVVSTPMMSENNFLMLDSDRAGALFIREDLRRGDYAEVTRDLEGQVFFVRYREAVIQPSAIVFGSGWN